MWFDASTIASSSSGDQRRASDPAVKRHIVPVSVAVISVYFDRLHGLCSQNTLEPSFPGKVMSPFAVIEPVVILLELVRLFCLASIAVRTSLV
jgi:hypothetical protein